MRNFCWFLMAIGALALGGCDALTKDQDRSSADEITQGPIDALSATRDTNDEMPEDDADENAALPQLSAELVAEYNSKLIKDASEFYLEDGRLCDRHKNDGECQNERDKRENWNFAIQNEIGRHEFLRDFKGKKTLIIPGNSGVAGKYRIYGSWFDSDNSNGTIYIGDPRPFESERFVGQFAHLFLFPLAYLGNAPDMFIVPFYNFDKRRVYEQNANAAIRWVVVDCQKKTQFTNTVVYFEGDLKNKNVLQSYANDDRVLDYNISFSRLKTLMTSAYPFDHLPSSPFNDVCS